MTAPEYRQPGSVAPQMDQRDERAPAQYADNQPSYRDGVEPRRTGQALRVFQILAGVAGAILFGMGIAAVFRVDFAAGFFKTSGTVAGFGFSPALAIAAILLGGAILATAFADQDRGSTAVVGLLTVAVGIAALVVGSGTSTDVSVDRKSALLFVVLGAAAFLFSLLPWWGRRSRVVRTEVR